MSTETRGDKARLLWVDALRGLAVVGMVWTHCANTFLESSLQETSTYEWAGYFHGLIAPTFFWLSGWVRGGAVWKPDEPLWPSVRRLLVIFALGHLLHLPWSQWAAGDFSEPTWRTFLQADVLQCLALSGLLLLLIERSGRWSTAVAVLLMAIILWLTDPLRSVQTGLMPVDMYLNRNGGSLFPLFPWMAFALGGFVCGRMKAQPMWLAITGVTAVVVIWTLIGAHGTVSFFLERLGWVLAFAGVVGLLEAYRSSVLWPRWLLLAGRRSLSAYVIHLLLIYSIPLGSAGPLSVVLGMNQELPAVLGWFLLVLVLTLGIVALLEWRKTRLDTAAGRALQ